jgi:thioredoxin reductase (NADPH)
MPSDPARQELGVAVVGAGPAGLAAGIHLARAGISHRVFERAEPGGLLRSAGLVECYPGFPGGVQAAVLVRNMVAQARGLGVDLQTAEVESLGWTRAGFELVGDAGPFRAAAVILATGTRPRALAPGLVGDPSALSRIHHETCTLPEQLHGARVWISGGGDAAFDSGLQLVERGAQVHIAVRGRPRALGLLIRRARERGIALHLGCSLETVDARFDGLELGLAGRGGERRERVDQLLVCHGRDPEVSLWQGLTSEQARDPHRVESLYPGLFLAGDLVRGSCRYAGVAVGDGLRCARLAEAHLERYRGASPQLSPGSS